MVPLKSPESLVSTFLHLYLLAVLLILTHPSCHLCTSPSRSHNSCSRTRNARAQKEKNHVACSPNSKKPREGTYMEEPPRRGSHTSRWYKPISMSTEQRIPALPPDILNHFQVQPFLNLDLTQQAQTHVQQIYKHTSSLNLKTVFFKANNQKQKG